MCVSSSAKTICDRSELSKQFKRSIERRLLISFHILWLCLCTGIHFVQPKANQNHVHIIFVEYIIWCDAFNKNRKKNSFTLLKFRANFLHWPYITSTKFRLLLFGVLHQPKMSRRIYIFIFLKWHNNVKFHKNSITKSTQQFTAN